MADTKTRARPTVPQELVDRYLGKEFYLSMVGHGGLLFKAEAGVLDLRWRYGKLDALVAARYPSGGVVWVQASRLEPILTEDP